MEIEPEIGRIQERGETSVVLKCEEKKFADFISQLLGSPETLRASFVQRFEVTPERIRDLFHLVDQRVSEQNRGKLIRFQIVMAFDDGSSVTVNSLDEFMSYRQVRALVAVSLGVHWTYLIEFGSKTLPQKQHVCLTFAAPQVHEKKRDPFEIILNALGPPGDIHLKIEYTERSWAADINSLIIDAVENFEYPESRFRKWSRNQSGWIVVGVFLFCLFATVFTSFIQVRRFGIQQVDKARSFLASNGKGGLDGILELLVNGAWPKFLLFLVGWFAGTLAISVWLSLWTGSLAGKPHTSFILVSEKSSKNKEAILHREKMAWFKFICSVVVSFVVSVLSNYIFKWLAGD